MYSGSVSARQLTNHNTRYRMLMDTYKFLNNLLKEILRRSNHIYMHTNTCTFTWLHAPPQHTPHGLCGFVASLFLQGVVPTRTPLALGDAGAPAPRVPVLIPATPNACVGEKHPLKLQVCTQGSLLSVLWGHMQVPRGPHLLAPRPFCHKGFQEHSCSS